MDHRAVAVRNRIGDDRKKLGFFIDIVVSIKVFHFLPVELAWGHLFASLERCVGEG